MGLWQRLRDLDYVIIAVGRHMQLDDVQLKAWWDELPPEHRVAVWDAARSQQPDDPEAVRAWVGGHPEGEVQARAPVDPLVRGVGVCSPWPAWCG